MQRNLNHDEFDQFLKGAADNLRMCPSDRVWKNIAKELDRRKRRFATLFALTLLLLSAAYITWEVATTQTHLQAARQQSLQPSFSTATSAARSVPLAPAVAAAPRAKVPQQTNTAANNSSKKQIVNKQIRPASNPFINTEIASITGSDANNETSLSKPSETIDVAPYHAAPVALLTSGKKALQPKLRAEQQLFKTTMLPERNVSINAKPRIRKWSWQIFATPTVSYRKLSDNKNYVRPILTTGMPANFSALYGINEAVIHKPDLGIEFGIMGRYPIAKNLRLRAGFQFNVSRYDIKAFSYVPEVATFALNNGFWVDSVRAISNYRTVSGGGGSNWLQNFYFQASIPVGLELKVAGNKRTHWGIASSLQPTYVIGNRSYMITADYKNYARVPWLTRRWNVNTSLETFVSINSGKTQWQIGPQVRYQALSSFINKYPVKENLFDFGMKVGVTLK